MHYDCDETNGWNPDLAEVESKITENTHGLVIINPNNPTGAVYSEATVKGLIDIARRHDLVVFADEIYEKIIFDDAVHHHAATYAGSDVLCLTFSGLSKAYRVCGYRAGWVMISGPKEVAEDFLEGLTLIANMRMCANVPAQHAIQTALGGYQSIEELIVPGGRFYEQNKLADRLLNEIPGVINVAPRGALYCFPRLDPEVYPIEDDETFVIDLLRAKKILVTHGTGFNWPAPDHFRLVTLPDVQVLEEAIGTDRGVPRGTPVTRAMRDLTYPPIILAAKTGFRLLGQRFQITGTEHVPRSGGVLLACNHIGYVDFVYGGLAADPAGPAGPVHGQARDLRPPDRRPADALDAPHRGGPRRRRGVVPHGGGLPARRRGGRHLPRGHDLAVDGAQGVQDRRGPDRGRGRRPAASRWSCGAPSG